MGLTSIAPLNTEAATYEAWSERGVKYLAYSKNYLYWSTNSSSITASDTDQSSSGLFIHNLGAQKITSLSSTTKHTYNFKNEFLAGAVIGGQTLGFSDIIIDQGRAYSSGNAYWDYDL